MNERIEALAKQAFMAGLDTDPVLYYEVEQFAKLIVQECINTVKKDSVITLEDKIGLILSIKEQFGVEL